jgi:tetratricopeptide (TPR) repeat protein
MAASLNLAVPKEKEFMQLAKCSTEAAKKVALDLDEKNWANLLYWNHSFELSKFCSDQNFSNYLQEVDFLASNASFLISNQAYVLLGNILYSMNEAAMCLQISRQAVKTIPYFMSNVAIYPFLELAKKYELNNFPEAAVKCLEKAVSCFPSNAIARMILCILYLRTDNQHSCEKYIDELIKEKTGGNIVRIIQTAILLNEGDGISLKKAKKNMAFLEHQSISQAEMNFLCSLEK